MSDITISRQNFHSISSSFSATVLVYVCVCVRNLYRCNFFFEFKIEWVNFICVNLTHIVDSFRHQNANVVKKKCRRNLQKIASAQLPKNPTSSDDVTKAFAMERVMEHYGTTLQNGNDADKLTSKPFFQYAHHSKAFDYCIFASLNIINGIKEKIPVERRQYLMDATFKVCPFGSYNQLLIIHVEHLEEVSDPTFL